MRPTLVSMGVQPKQLKLKDVNRLLSKHYGIFWKTLENVSFYRNVLEKWYV
jgi:hypothetical protein